MPPLSIHPSLLAAMDEFYGVDRVMEDPVPLQAFGRKSKVGGKKKMKILYVTFFQYPHTGGLSHYITSIQTGFEQLGHEVDVFAPNQMSSLQLEKWIPQAAYEARRFMHNRYGTVSEKIVKYLSFLHVFELFLKRKRSRHV